MSGASPRRKKSARARPARDKTDGDAGDRGAGDRGAGDRDEELVAAAPGELPQRVVMGAALVVALGLGMVGVGPSEVGRWVTLAGLLGLIYGIHTLGRMGEDRA